MSLFNCLLIYCTVLYLDFARWSILDVVDSRRSVNVVTCIISCIGSGIFWTGFFEMPEEYIMVEQRLIVLFRVSRCCVVRKLGSVPNSRW